MTTVEKVTARLEATIAKLEELTARLEAALIEAEELGYHSIQRGIDRNDLWSEWRGHGIVQIVAQIRKRTGMVKP